MRSLKWPFRLAFTVFRSNVKWSALCKKHNQSESLGVLHVISLGLMKLYIMRKYVKICKTINNLFFFGNTLCLYTETDHKYKKYISVYPQALFVPTPTPCQHVRRRWPSVPHSIRCWLPFLALPAPSSAVPTRREFRSPLDITPI